MEIKNTNLTILTFTALIILASRFGISIARNYSNGGSDQTDRNQAPKVNTIKIQSYNTEQKHK